MIDLLRRYLTENYSPDALLFLPNFQTQKVEKVAPPPLSTPKLTVTKTAPPPIKAAPIVLEKPTPIEPVFQPKLATLLSQVAPHLFIHKEPLRDDKAQQVKTKFLLPKIPLLYTKSLETYRPFLENVAKAVNALMGSCRLVDVDTLGQLDSFSLVIAPDVTIFSSPHLITHFKEVPATGEKWLGTAPLFLLPDLALYRKDHNLKRSLWLELKKLCMPPSSSTNR